MPTHAPPTLRSAVDRTAPRDKSAAVFLGASSPYRRLYLAAMRLSLHALQALSPALAGKAALSAFLTPPRRRPVRHEERGLLATARSYKLPLRGAYIHVNAWGRGPTVHVVHGWGARSTTLWLLIKDLVGAGYRVVAHDGPAHGSSDGRRTDMGEYAEAICRVSTNVDGPVFATVGHCFGAANTLLAVDRYDLKPGKLVLSGCFDRATEIIDHFASRFGIRSEVVDRMRAEHERRYGFQWSWEELVLSDMLSQFSGPVLLIHDRNDTEIPVENVHALFSRCRHAVKYLTEGYGHRRVLQSPGGRRAILDFLRSEDHEPPVDHLSNAIDSASLTHGV